MKNFINYLKVGGCLVGSYLIVLILTEIFFVGNSPLMRAKPMQYAGKRIQQQYNQLLALFSIETDEVPTEQVTPEEFKEFISKANTSNMQSVAPGSYVANIKGEDVHYIKLNEVPSNKLTYQTSKGPIEIKVLKGCKPPTLEEVEEMIK